MNIVKMIVFSYYLYITIVKAGQSSLSVLFEACIIYYIKTGLEKSPHTVHKEREEILMRF